MDKFDKSQLKTLCRGNRTDRGWTQTPEGNWVPSQHDRRRIGVAEMNLVAEVNGLPGLPMPVCFGILVEHHSTGDDDAKTLLENFGRWMQQA